MMLYSQYIFLILMTVDNLKLPLSVGILVPKVDCHKSPVLESRSGITISPRRLESILLRHSHLNSWKIKNKNILLQ